MKILLDPQTYNEQKYGGISRYYTELYINLRNKNNVKINCPIYFSDNLHLKEAKLFQNFKNKIVKNKLIFKFIRKKILKINKSKNIQKTINHLKNNNFDIFIPTYYSTYFLDYLNNKPFVLTVYDMIHEMLPQYFEKDQHVVKNKKLLIEKSTKIIAISESTKNDIIAIYPHIDASKIEIVYLAHSIKAISNSLIKLPKQYILFVGNRTIYKNFLFFIKSVAPVLINNKELFVVCAGGGKFIDEETQLINELGISNQVIHNKFDDNELSTYYSNAKCFVFPSEYEGFGIPVLESMACGCPVVLANHSSFPEVAGNAGVYFELNNEADLRNKVIELLNNEQLRKEYINLGFQQAQKFSWKKTADECLKVYQKAIDNGK